MSDRDEFKIYIGNLDPITTAETVEAAIRDCMGQSLPIMSVRIIKDSDGRGKGYGFVGFQSPEIVKEVIEKMDGMEMDGRNIKVNETKSDGYRPKERGPLDSGRDRDRDMDRGRAPTDSYPPHTDSGRKFRISINNLPEHFTWRELKDFLRTGAQSVSYANVNHAGFGVGDYDSAADREDAIRKLDGCKVDGSIVTVREMAHPSDAGRDDRGPPREPFPGPNPDGPYRPLDRNHDRRVDPYRGSYDQGPPPRGSRPPSSYAPPSERQPRYRDEYPDPRAVRPYEEEPYESRRVRPRSDGPPPAYPVDYPYGREYPIAQEGYLRAGPAAPPHRPHDYYDEPPRGPAPHYPRQAAPYREGSLPPPRQYEDVRGAPPTRRGPAYDDREPPSYPRQPPRSARGDAAYAYPAAEDYGAGSYGSDRSRGGPPGRSRDSYAPY